MMIPNKADYTFESKQHTIVVSINSEEMDLVFKKNPEMKEQFHSYILDNPFDTYRNYIMGILRSSVSYMEKLSDLTLKRLYYQSSSDYYEKGSTLFDIGDKCKFILIVLHGTIEITLSDGVTEHQIDCLGKGSIIGSNNVLVGEKWIYKAKVRSLSAYIFCIEFKTLKAEMEACSFFHDQVMHFQESH